MTYRNRRNATAEIAREMQVTAEINAEIKAIKALAEEVARVGREIGNGSKDYGTLGSLRMISSRLLEMAALGQPEYRDSESTARNAVLHKLGLI